MVKLTAIIAKAEAESDKPWVAFEFYPPRTPDGVANLYKRFGRMEQQSACCAVAVSRGGRPRALVALVRGDGSAAAARARSAPRPPHTHARARVAPPLPLDALQSPCTRTSRGARAAAPLSSRWRSQSR